jgi:hypothetical protein
VRRRWRKAVVTVVNGNRAAAVKLASLPKREHLGLAAIRLDDIWIAAGLADDLIDLRFDFVGEGGYRPSLHGCAPLAGSLLPHGHLLLESCRIEWDEETNLTCSYRVKGLTMIVAEPAPVL